MPMHDEPSEGLDPVFVVEFGPDNETSFTHWDTAVDHAHALWAMNDDERRGFPQVRETMGRLYRVWHYIEHASTWQATQWRANRLTEAERIGPEGKDRPF